MTVAASGRLAPLPDMSCGRTRGGGGSGRAGRTAGSYASNARARSSISARTSRVALGRFLDLGGVGPLLVHGDDRGRQVRPGHPQVRRQLAARAAGGALDVRAAQGDDVEVAHRAKPRRPQVARLVERHPELAGDVAPEHRGPVDRGVVQYHGARRAGALELHLVDDRDVHRERGRVHHRQRQRLPLRRQRAAHREEAGHPRLQHPLVHAEGDGRLPSLPAQRQSAPR